MLRAKKDSLGQLRSSEIEDKKRAMTKVLEEKKSREIIEEAAKVKTGKIERKE